MRVAALLEKSVVSPTLIGRAEQLAALSRGLEAACAGHSQVVLLAGEAGVGKTRLALETSGTATRLGLEVLQGSCLEPDRSVPYAALIDLSAPLPGPAAGPNGCSPG